jgi:hypothetical protein
MIPVQNRAHCAVNTPRGTLQLQLRVTLHGRHLQFQKFMGIGVLAFDATSTASALSGDGTTLVGYSSDSSNVHSRDPLRRCRTPSVPGATDGVGLLRNRVSSNGGVVVGVCSFDSPEAGTPGRRSFRYTPGDGIVTIPPTPLAADTDIDAAAVSDDATSWSATPCLIWGCAGPRPALGAARPARRTGRTGLTASIVTAPSSSGSTRPCASNELRWTAATGKCS